MGKLIVTEYISLDGVIEAPGGGESFKHAGWTFGIARGPDGDAFKLDETRQSAALLFGRATYEGMAAAWPHMTGEIADKWNSMPKYVVSTTLTEPAWHNTRVLRGDLGEEINRLKDDVDGDIVVHGSAQLANSLFELGLVDELRLMIFPIVLGSGKRFFGNADEAKRYRLMNSTSVGDGVSIAVYTPLSD